MSVDQGWKTFSAYHVESRFWQRIMCTRKNLLERADGVFQRDEATFVTGEDLSNLERLRHETLDLAGTFDLD